MRKRSKFHSLEHNSPLNGARRNGMESLQILHFNEIPSAAEFTSQIEPKNVPAVFRGCVGDWEAITKWNTSSGGLDYLQDLAGTSTVEAMLSRSAPVFYGDIRNHERVPFPFSTFVGYCKDRLRHEDEGQDSISQLRGNQNVGLTSQLGDSLTEDEVPQQIYLAQVPIVNTANEERVQLECLRGDIEVPALLEGKLFVSVNLWMNSARSRSSTHYDPHHNLLCIVSGSKQVVLWPPSASRFLYPLPLYGEASNHSAISLEKTDFLLHPRAKCLDEHSQKVILQAGDALFIPEGWYHQVDSGSVTIAVNFWWQSEILSGLLDHMDAYYLRRILKRLTDKEINRMLVMPSVAGDIKVINAGVQSNHGNAAYGDQAFNLNHQSIRSKGTGREQRFMLHELEPHELHSLHELVSLVHDRVSPSQPINRTEADPSVTVGETEVRRMWDSNIYNLREDPLAGIIWTLEPHTFRSVFLAMKHNFPRTLEALILHALSPVGAEVLTRKFEEMDHVIEADDRSSFYLNFYDVFNNESSAMDALLNGKELFASQAFKTVLVQYLGNDFDGPNPLVE